MNPSGGGEGPNTLQIESEAAVLAVAHDTTPPPSSCAPITRICGGMQFCEPLEAVITDVGLLRRDVERIVAQNAMILEGMRRMQVMLAAALEPRP